MGQYYKGEKIGTCENMYYLNLATGQKLAEQSAADDDGVAFSEYLKDNITRWRFAWPEEDGAKFPDCGKDPFKVFSLPCPVEVNHDRITVHNTHQGGGYGINIFLPCPHSSNFPLEMSRGGAGEQFISVKYQAIRDGAEKTIFACARCGHEQRFDDAETVKIKERAKEYFAVYHREEGQPGGDESYYQYAMKIIERIK